MRIHGQHWRTIALHADGWRVEVIDQTLLPFAFRARLLSTMPDAAEAIRTMVVRGAPLIGAAAAYGVALAMRADASDASLAQALAELGATRPTAVNLHWALGRMRRLLEPLSPAQRQDHAYAEAALICDEDVALCSAIGDHGLGLIRDMAAEKPGRPLNILTHCNAGWLATVDWGTALAPIYMAHDRGIDLHVWVDETRPRNQGALLTTWELGRHGVAHTLVVDNAGGHLMQHGEVDLVIVGADRVTRTGDVANKIGTYLKALAAHDNGVPFWVAVPSSTIDWTISDGIAQIPIEERPATEVTVITGRALDGAILPVRVVPTATPAANPAFDVTPSRLVTGLITERGTCAATARDLARLFPEHG